MNDGDSPFFGAYLIPDETRLSLSENPRKRSQCTLAEVQGGAGNHTGVSVLTRERCKRLHAHWTGATVT